MKITYPHVIENSIGEKIIFHELRKESDGDRLVAESFAITPGTGPVMHTHWLQDEGFTVVKGKIGYEVQGQPVKYAAEGDSIVFERGTPHRFWNAGQEALHCTCWVKPVNTFPFFITSIFAAQNKSGKGKPEMFDGAYLMTRYSAEYDISGIPKFVKKVVMPVTYFIGKILGKYKHFKDAPKPVKE
jgi:quercetin dioxygenase-like cupin family protein